MQMSGFPKGFDHGTINGGRDVPAKIRPQDGFEAKTTP